MRKRPDSPGAEMATGLSHGEAAQPVRPSPPSARHKRTPRQVVAEGFQRVERKVGPAIHHHRRERPSGRTTKATGTVPTDELVARVQNDLRTEREQILEPLLRRLRAIGQRLTDDHEVPPEVVVEGLASGRST